MIKITIIKMTKTINNLITGRETQLRSPFYSPLNSMWQVGGGHDDDDGDNDKRVISGRGNDLIISTEHMLGPGKGYNYILCQNIIYHHCDH